MFYLFICLFTLKHLFKKNDFWGKIFQILYQKDFSIVIVFSNQFSNLELPEACNGFVRISVYFFISFLFF